VNPPPEETREVLALLKVRTVDNRARFLRWVAELSQDDRDPADRLVEKLLHGKPRVDRWINGEVWLHVNARIRAGLLDVDACEFCAWIKNTPGIVGGEVSIDAVPGLSNFVGRGVWNRQDGLKRPVLVETRKLVKNEENVTVEVPLPCDVWLTSPDFCDVCSADARKFSGIGVVEPSPGGADRKVDAALFLFRDALAGPLVERPRDVVEGTSEVMDEISEQESPERGEWISGLLDADDDPMTLSVVFLSHGDWNLQIGLSCEGVDVVAEHLRVDYPPSEFQPGRLKGVFHGR